MLERTLEIPEKQRITTLEYADTAIVQNTTGQQVPHWNVQRHKNCDTRMCNYIRIAALELADAASAQNTTGQQLPCQNMQLPKNGNTGMRKYKTDTYAAAPFVYHGAPHHTPLRGVQHHHVPTREVGDRTRVGTAPVDVDVQAGGTDIRYTSFVTTQAEATTQSSRQYQQGYGNIDITRSGATNCGIKQIKTLVVLSDSIRNLISTGWDTIVAEPTQTFVEKKVAAIKWLADTELSIPRSGFDACYTFLDPYISPDREGVGGVLTLVWLPRGRGEVGRGSVVS